MSQVFGDLSDVCVFSGLKIWSKHSKPLVKSVPYPILPKLGVSSQVPGWHLHWVGIPREANMLPLLIEQKLTVWNCDRSVPYAKGDINPHRNDSSWVITTLFLLWIHSPFFPLPPAHRTLHSHYQGSFWSSAAAKAVQHAQAFWPHHKGNSSSISWNTKFCFSTVLWRTWMPLENETCFLPLQDYHDHIAEISAKLVAIMDSLFDKLLSKVMIYGNNYTFSKLQLEVSLYTV